MAEGTDKAEAFAIGAEASCPDGFCGKVSRLVIDPVARTVTHLVIEPKHQRESGRLVPVRLVDTSTGHIRLRCTIAEFDELDPAEETDLVEGIENGGGYGLAEAVQGYVGAGGHRSRRAWLRPGHRHGPGTPYADRGKRRHPAG